MTVPVSIQYTAKQGFVIPANCKVMALCDDTVETVTGTELFSNPPPITTTASWVAGANTTLSVSATNLRATSVAAGTYSTYQNAVTVTGKRYKAHVYINANSLPATVYIGAYQTGVGVIETATISVSTTGYSQLDFTAASAATDLLIYATATGAGQYFEVSVLSMVIVDDDISGNDLGLIHKGSLVKSAAATNSTTVAYGPFSASNYLYQPYNSALDFGTSAFHCGSWFKCTTPSVAAVIFERAYWNGAARTGSLLLSYITSAGLVVFTISDDGLATNDTAVTASAYDDGIWHYMFAQRVSNTIYLYIDASLVATVAVSNASASLTNTSAGLRVGLGWDSGNPAEYLAGFRIGTGSFTAAKIKADYDKEKTMFRYGGVFAIDGQESIIDMSSVASLERRSPENIGETNVALDGTAWGVTDRIEQGWSVTTDFINEADRGKWEHFFRSCKTGESFTFDSHGTSAAPVDALTHRLLPGAKLARVGSTEKFSASFDVVEIGA